MEVQAVPQYVASDGDTVATLPKYVVFKGDNDKYLAAYWHYSHEYLQFNTADIGMAEVRHEVVEVGEGKVMLKSSHWNKFWRRSPNWIWADTDNSDSSNKDMLFEATKVDDERVALRNLGNDAFCKRLTTEGNTDCLNASAYSLESGAIFYVGEPTLSRRVYSIVYDLDNAVMYNPEPESLTRETATNPSDELASMALSYSYTEKKSTSWKCGVSFTTGVKTTFETGIPAVVDGKVEVSAELTVSGEWGATEETATTVTGTYTTPVKGGETVELTVTGTHAKCDVPFSYIQEDLLTTGERVETPKDDGLFTGVNTTDINFEVRSI